MSLCQPAILVTPDDWDDWAPTFFGFTVGASTVVPRFVMIGNTCIGDLGVTLGAGFAMTGPLQFSPPVPIASRIGTPVGDASLVDTGTNTFDGRLLVATATRITVLAINTASTRATFDQCSSIVPYTWAVGDKFDVQFGFEAA